MLMKIVHLLSELAGLVYLLPPPNQLEMPLLALAASSSTLLSNLSTAFRVSALASLAYDSMLLLVTDAWRSASAS
jgi:hypothetical protein